MSNSSATPWFVGSSVCGIFQARILEYVAISFSRRSSQPRDQTCFPILAACLPLSHQRSPMKYCSATKEENFSTDDPGGHHGKWNKSDRERKILYMTSLLCGILKKYQTHRNRRTVVTRDLRQANNKMLVKGYRLSAGRIVSSEELMYSIVTVANNPVSHMWKLLRDFTKKKTSMLCKSLEGKLWQT